MAMQITITRDDILAMAAAMVLTDGANAANTFLRDHTSMSLSERYAFLRAADQRPIGYVCCGRGVHAVHV